MNVGIGTEAAQFLFREYINSIFLFQEYINSIFGTVCIVKGNTKYKIPACLHLLILMTVPKASSNFYSFSLIGWFFSVYRYARTIFMAGFRNNFQDHMGLLNPLLESQTGIRKPEQASWRRLLEGFLELVISKKQAETLFWISSKKESQNDQHS
jgi:hypothetical protein